MKKVIFPLAISALLLTACNSEITTQKQYIEPKYEELVYYEGKYDNKHIDVIVNDEKRMYEINEKFDEVISSLEKKDLIKIEYTMDSELKKVVKDIKVVKKNSEMTEEEKITDNSYSQDAKGNEEEEISENIKLDVYNGEDFETQEAKTIKYEKVASVKILNDYKTENAQSVISIKNQDYNTSIKFSKLEDNVEIQKQRWRAAEKLKENGVLKETKEVIVPNAELNTEFIFYSQGEKFKKYILIKNIDKTLTNIEISIPNGYVGKKEEYEIWAMISSFNWLEK